MLSKITYSNTINFLIFLFPVLIFFVKELSDLIIFIFFVLGVYRSFKDKCNIFKIKELKVLTFITLGYYVSSFMIFSINSGEIYFAKYLQSDIYFLIAPFVALSIFKANLKINFMFYGLSLSLFLVVVDFLLFNYGLISNSFIKIYISMFAPLLVMVSVLFALQLKDKFNTKIFFGLLLFLLSMVVVIDTGIRASWVSFFILVFVFLAYINNKYNISKTIYFSIVVVLLSFYNSSVVNDEISFAYNEIIAHQEKTKLNTSVGSRIEMYSSGIMAAKTKPFFGHGYLNGTKVASLYSDDSVSSQIRSFVQLHNEYITTLVEKGLFGVVFLLILLIYPMIIFYKNSNNIYGIAGLLLTIGFFTFGLFNVSFGDGSMKMFYVFFLSIFLPAVLKNNSKD
jgi:O-antigen ligase